MYTLLLLLLIAGESEVSGARALETVKVLASDEFQGRKSGLESGKRAEEWMAEKLEKIGLEPGNGGSYFHGFKAAVTEDGAKPTFVLNGKERKYLDDYVTLIYSGRGTVESEVVFVGHGVDYGGLDVKGKIVMAIRGGPVGEEQRYIGWKSSTAADRGAAGFILVEGDKAVPGTIQETYHRTDLPAIWISRKAADELLKPKTLEQIKKDPGPYVVNGAKVRLEVHARLLRDQPMRNVVGIWPGRQADEYVVLGAHLDHVGVDGAGNVYNGADDNASGSSMLLEVARAIAASGKPFRRTLVFCWFAGEEQGLLGSWAFVKNPPVPLARIAVMLNTDMVGQGKPVMAVGGAEVYPDDAERIGFDVEGFTWEAFRSQSNSDHYPFQASGVPAFFMHTKGPHPNYHQPGDDWANIKVELLETAGRYVRRLAERAAEADGPFLREGRAAGYLWHAAFTVALEPPHPPGTDILVKWFDADFNAIDAELTRLESKKAPQNLMLPTSKPRPLLNDLRPTVVLGIRGHAAVDIFRPARRLGVLMYAPYLGDRERKSLAELGRQEVIVYLGGAPLDLDPAAVAALPAPLLIPSKQAALWRTALSKRKHPWLAVKRLESADEILALREALGAAHVLLVPGEADPAAVVGELLAAGLKPAQIKRLLGGNFLRMLEGLTRKKRNLMDALRAKRKG